MKKFRFILMSVLIVSLSTLFQPAGGQEKTKAEKEKELQLQEELVQQKKEFAEQKKAQDDVSKAMNEQKKVIEKAMKEAQDQMKEASKYQDRERAFRGAGENPRFEFNGEPFVFAPGMDAWHGFPFGGENERTTWDFTKSLKENSFTGDYTFDVEPTASNVVMSVNGDCKAGEIRIKILMPNGKTYSDIVIDEFGNLNWRKSFTISEEENKDKAGAWKFKIDANKATGFFKISLQTY
jgi:ATPase subunit of ABC transporter with duplicated ATPase domains